MRKLFMPLAGIGLAAACATSALAAPPPSPAVDPASVEMPVLAFTPDAEAEKNYDKYFYFHREGTDFATALSDIRECDGYARGLSYNAGGVTPYMPYGGMLGGAIGGAIGSAMADAIFGSAERRKQRRMNLRTCMGFKEYKTYGLPKELWTKFNFEEGLTAVDEERRQTLLAMQAKVASGPKPTAGEIAQ